MIQQDTGGFTDLADPGIKQHELDRLLYVEFYLRPMMDNAASDEAGRPIYKDQEFVKIIVPGSPDQVDRPVFDLDKKRFPSKYEQFKKGKSKVVDGTPLSAWPSMPRALVKELEHFNVYTVEQLAEMPDGNAKNVGPIESWRQKARVFIEAAKGNAPLEKMHTELAKRDQTISALQEQVRQLVERMGQADKQPSAKKAS